MKGRKMNYYFQSAMDVPESTPFKRIGIIPYFFNQEEIHLFLMLDANYNELTDCGGLPKKGETWIETAIRETSEESREFFNFTRECILESGSVFWREDHRIAIVFMNVSHRFPNLLTADSFCYKYRQSYLDGKFQKDRKELLENSDMVYHSLDTIKVMARHTNRIYIPVKRLLMKFTKTHPRTLFPPVSEPKYSTLEEMRPILEELMK